MIITIHQPEHLIWLGLIDKISKSDTFVVLDTVQFRKNYFQNRNKIRTKTGWQWLTVPIKKHPLKTLIKEIEISKTINWQEDYLALLEENYRKTKYFLDYFPKIKKIILEKDKFLTELNLKLINLILELFDLKIQQIKASELNLSKNLKGSRLILEICKKLKAKTYLAGISGKDYLRLAEFKSEGMKVIFHQFDQPIYRQVFEPFIPGMSSIDLLFNYGPKVKNILFSKGRIPRRLASKKVYCT